MHHLDTGITKIVMGRGAMAADADMYAMAVDAAARAYDEGDLQRYLPVAEEAAARANHDLYMAVIHRARGVAHKLAGEKDEAAAMLATALDEFRRLDTGWQAGRTLVELGDVEQSRGNTAEAERHYSEAFTAFEALGAAPDAERARNALAGLA